MAKNKNPIKNNSNETNINKTNSVSGTENIEKLEQQSNENQVQEIEEDEINLKYESKGKVAKGGLLGFFIGLAVIIPGVSGSAVAIIFKMYEKFLYAISNLFKNFKKCFKFLFPIAIGIVLGFVLGFFGIKALINVIPFIIVCLFAGLMFGAYPAVTDQIKGTQKSAKNIVLFVVGLVIPISISLASVLLNTGDRTLENLKFYHYIIFVLLGFLISITQLVPGLSATALLMTFGYFTPIMNSVSFSNIKENPMILLVYVCLVVGFLIGLFSVSKGLSYMLGKHRVSTFYTVAGLSLGSIVTMFFNPEIVEVYNSWGTSGTMIRDLIIGIILFLIGVFLSYLFVNVERKNDKKSI